jgi:hypothetical protein
MMAKIRTLVLAIFCLLAWVNADEDNNEGNN